MNTNQNAFPIAPGNWLGIVGGGQLGRMFCHAAQSLGYRVAVLDPARQCPAGSAGDLHIQADYDDVEALQQLGRLCAAVTTEFENVPAASFDLLATLSRVSPAASAVAIAQDRIREKAFLDQAGVRVAPYIAVHTANDIFAAPEFLFPGVLKAARMGYDGKGQERVASRDDALQAWQNELDGVACVLEALLPLASEISVVLARDFHGEIVTYTPAVNEHRDGILAISVVDPLAGADDSHHVHHRATQAARDIVQALDYVGVLCVEFFILADGTLIVNEIAPRPHNSGHYTLDACVVSQFEQQARIMAGLPLGYSVALCPTFMLNILGDLWFGEGDEMREPDWSGALRVSGAKLHLYGKNQARKGRKMGHVNVLGATLESVRADAKQVARALRIRF